MKKLKLYALDRKIRNIIYKAKISNIDTLDNNSVKFLVGYGIPKFYPHDIIYGIPYLVDLTLKKTEIELIIYKRV